MKSFRKRCWGSLRIGRCGEVAGLALSFHSFLALVSFIGGSVIRCNKYTFRPQPLAPGTRLHLAIPPGQLKCRKVSQIIFDYSKLWTLDLLCLNLTEKPLDHHAYGQVLGALQRCPMNSTFSMDCLMTGGLCQPQRTSTIPGPSAMVLYSLQPSVYSSL